MFIGFGFGVLFTLAVLAVTGGFYQYRLYQSSQDWASVVDAGRGCRPVGTQPAGTVYTGPYVVRCPRVPLPF